MADIAPPKRETFVGFRRRFRITPSESVVIAEVEDDIHHMIVCIEHDGQRAVKVDAEQPRAPWTTCPGAIEALKETFEGLELAAFASRAGKKKQNCTHLYDLAILAAARAHDSGVLQYDVYVSDPVEGRRKAEIWCKDRQLFCWTIADMEIVEPSELAGKGLFELNDWLRSLSSEGEQEAARVLRWASLVANGRILPFEEQSDALKMPPNCYTFQPDKAVVAKRVGRVRDFSRGNGEPLDNDL